jgi:hypothetical protein
MLRGASAVIEMPELTEVATGLLRADRRQFPRVFQVQAQQAQEPADFLAQRADYDRTAIGRKARRHGQCPCSGAVEEGQPGQVQNQPLSLLIGGERGLGQQPACLAGI